jgi:hypothetical protein
MASVNKKLVMMGVSVILIPLGKSILKKIVKEITGKVDSQSSDEEKVNLVSNPEKVRNNKDSVSPITKEAW